MVDGTALLGVAGGIALLLSNGFFVTTEFALTRVRQFPRSEFEGSGLDRAWEMTERLELYLSGCQLGITISSVGLGIVAEPATSTLFGALFEAVGLSAAPAGGAAHTGLSVLVAVVVINLLHVIVAEQAPTYLGIERTKTVCRYGSTPLYWWTTAMWPVIRGADRVSKALLGAFGVEITRSWTEAEEPEAPTTRGELRRHMGQALSGAGVSGERQEEVLRALEIGEIPVRDIAVPREDVVALSTEDDVETNLDRMRRSAYVRFPLVGTSLADRRGIVYAPAVLRHLDAMRAGQRSLEEVAAPPMSIDADASVSDAIDRFQAEHQELAFVVDGDEVVGIVTATDALEAVMGEIEDPLDVEREDEDS